APPARAVVGVPLISSSWCSVLIRRAVLARRKRHPKPLAGRAIPARTRRNAARARLTDTGPCVNRAHSSTRACPARPAKATACAEALAGQPARAPRLPCGALVLLVLGAAVLLVRPELLARGAFAGEAFLALLRALALKLLFARLQRLFELGFL